MASNFNQPAITDTYANYTAGIVGNLQDLAKGLDPATCSVSNPPTSAIRYNSSVKYWEKYNGTAWANNEPAGGYAINISGNAATATTASAAPWSGVSGKPTTLSGYGVSSGDTLFDSKYAAKGVYTSSGLTFAATARLLGRSTAGPGAGEEISIGSGLSLSSGVLSCTVSAPVSSVVGQTGAVTAGQILTGLTAVDGAGSGLDADLLDGYHASSFAGANYNFTAELVYTNTVAQNGTLSLGLASNWGVGVYLIVSGRQGYGLYNSQVIIHSMGLGLTLTHQPNWNTSADTIASNSNFVADVVYFSNTESLNRASDVRVYKLKKGA